MGSGDQVRDPLLADRQAKRAIRGKAEEWRKGDTGNRKAERQEDRMSWRGVSPEERRLTMAELREVTWIMAGSRL